MINPALQQPHQQFHCEAQVTSTFFVLFEIFPFAAGSQRLAFHGSLYQRQKLAPPKFHVHVIVKMEMATPENLSRTLSERTRISAHAARKTVRKHDCTNRFIEKWCTLGINKSVYVLRAETINITRSFSLSDIDANRFPALHHLCGLLSLDAVLHAGATGTVEDYLPGRFTKFLNNDGHTNASIAANFPAAFAHWTWVESNGKLMVSDIQGVRTGAGYILTDPCIHSIADSDGYGATDLGRLGFQEFFQRHVCNELCRDVGLTVQSKHLDVGHNLRTRIVSLDGRPLGAFETGKGGKRYKNLLTALVRKDHVSVKRVEMAVRKESGRERGIAERRGTVEQNNGKVERRATFRVAERGNVSGETERLADSTQPLGCIPHVNKNNVGVARYGRRMSGLVGLFRSKRR